MQIVETVHAQLTADASQFIAGFEAASAEVEAFEKKTAKIGNPFQKGGFLTGAAAARELMAAMAKDAGRIAQTVTQSAQQVQGAAGMAARGIKVLERGIGGLAFQAAGVPGPIGKMSATLLGMGVGGPVTLAVIAGMGLIAAAFNKVGEAAEEAEKVSREAAERFTQHLGTIRGLSEKTDRSAILSQMARLQVALREVQSARLGARQTPAQEFETNRREALIMQEFDELSQRLTELDKIAGKPLEDIVEDLQDITREAQRAGAAIEMHMIPAFTELSAAEVKASIAAMKLPGLDADKTDLRTLGRDLRSELGKVVGDDKSQREIVNIGETMGDLLAQGVMGGFQDAASAMRAIFFAVLRFALGQISGGIFGAVNPAKSAATGAEKLGGGVLQGAMVGPELNVSMPAPMTPFDIARDAQWQRALRESIAVARSQGFK